MSPRTAPAHAAPTRAILFAAGLGKRLRPLTETLPKPLVLVGGRAMLDRAIDLLAEGGVRDIVINAAHLKEQIVAHVTRRREMEGCPSLTLSLEDAPLETGGGVLRAWKHLVAAAPDAIGGEPFFAMNSDIVLLPAPTPAAHPIQRLRDAWRPGLDALLLVLPVEKARGYDGAGDFYLTPGSGGLWIPRFRAPDEAAAPYVFTGLQLLHPRLFADAPAAPFSLNLLYRRCCEAAQGGVPRIGAVIHTGDWLHVGDTAGLAGANRYFARTMPS